MKLKTKTVERKSKFNFEFPSVTSRLNARCKFKLYRVGTFKKGASASRPDQRDRFVFISGGKLHIVTFKRLRIPISIS